MTMLFSNIIMQIKYYPEPVLSYKTHIYQHLFAVTNLPRAGSNITKESSDTSKVSNRSSTEALEPNKEESVQHQDTKDQEKKANPDASLQSNVVTATNDYDAIKASLVGHIESKSLATMMDKNTIIKEITEDTLHLIVINKMAEISLNKDEIKQKLEKILNDLLARPIKLKLDYMKKEDYFASLM